MKKNGIWRMAALLLGLCLLTGLLAGCADSPANPIDPTETTGTTETTATADPVFQGETVNIYGIVGPTGVGLVNLIKDSEKGDTVNTYNVRLVTAPDDFVAKISTGEADIAAVPTNLAANLYQKKSGGVRLLAINTLGVLSILENGDTIHSVDDLRGKTIYSTGQGANPEYILRHVLFQNGIDPDVDVKLEFVAENEELAALLVKGTAEVALVPEPLATTVKTKNTAIRTALSMTEEWEKLDTGSSLMMGCVIVRTDFANEHADAVKAFLTEYADSIFKAQQDVSGTAKLCEEYGVIASAAIAEKALPNCNLTFVAGKDMRPAIEGYYDVLFKAAPMSIGGAMPDAAFYYEG